MKRRQLEIELQSSFLVDEVAVAGLWLLLVTPRMLENWWPHVERSP
jgi:hypothetical protein